MPTQSAPKAPKRGPWQAFLDATLYNSKVNPLSGITKGMVTTFVQSADAWQQGQEGKATLLYPEMKKEISDTYRGAHELLLEPGGGLLCISCNLCAEACPVDCIEVTFQMDGKTRVLDQYNLDLSKCMFCDLCVEVCPSYCIIMTKKYEYSDYSRWEDSTFYLSREKGIEREATVEEFRRIILQGYQPKYSEVADYFAPEEIETLGVKTKPRKLAEKEAHKPAAGADRRSAVQAGAATVPMDYGTLGKERYEFWAADARKASELGPEERKEKGAFVALKKKNDAAGAVPGADQRSAVQAGASAIQSAAVPMDYGELGQAKYEAWAQDTRKASELSGDERKEKALYVKLSRANEAAGASPGASSGSAGPSAPPAATSEASAPVASTNDDYGELGKERYDFWLADARPASALSSDERKEKSLAIKIRRMRGE